MNKNLQLPDTIREELAQAAVLYKMLEAKEVIDSKLTGANRALLAIIEPFTGELWTKGRKQYEVTRKGELVWENWKARWWDFLANFDVYAGVDLQEGRFADDNVDWEETDEDGNHIWEDLRVAVCLRKMQIANKRSQKTALNPFTITFFCLLSEGRLEQSREWQFDIAFDSIFWSDIENIVNSSCWPEELGYDDVPWEKVIDDIIALGMEIAKDRWEEEDDDDDYVAPSEACTSETEVRERYEPEMRQYGYSPGFFYYAPYWTISDTAIAVGAIGLCWAIF
ncbi:MAG: hypothetical protein HQK83_18990 [Fibrobacteria bacterium]|nr:hypothetical protein [Fibrobacteria bacterium]